MQNVRNIVKISFFTALICLLSLIKLPVFPVPVSLAFFAVNTIVLISDLKVSFISVLLYVILGLCGLPVFSQGGGIGYVLNISFGYLLGFLVAPFTSFLAKKVFKTKSYNMILGIINIFTVYTFGCLYAWVLSYIYLKTKMDIKYLITYFVLIFIPTDMIFCYLSSKIAERLKRIVK